MYYDYKGWWISSAREYLSNFRNGAICVTWGRNDEDKMYNELPKLITSNDLDQYAYANFLMQCHRNDINDLYKALEIAKNLMHKGNGLGNYLYAFLIYGGKVLKKVDDIAYAHLVKANELIPDFAPGLFNVGICLVKGEGCTKNLDLGLQYIQRAKELGFNRAINYIGLLYYNGYRNFPLDYAKAFECFRESAFRGDENGYYYQAMMYRKGEGVSQDHKRSLDCYSLAGTKGHVDAAYYAGLVQITGEHHPVNYEAAAYHLENAAKWGHAKAMWMLGVLYLEKIYLFYGKQEEGKQWIIKSCRLGCQEAIDTAKKANIRY